MSRLRSRSRSRLRSRTPRAAALTCGVALAAVAGPAAHAADTPGAERSVQVVMVDFQDSALVDPAKLKSRLESTYYGRSGSLTSYYNEMTRGKTTFGPRASGQQVVGPLTLPMSATGCDTSKMAYETYKALAARGIAKDSFDHLSIVFPNAKADCGFGGLGSVGGPKTWMPAEHFSIDALIHEFGHNLGYHHHMRLRCPMGDLGAGCKEDPKDTTSHKSVMGGGGSAAGLTAPELIHNNWLTGGELARVDKSATYTLRPLAGGGGGVRALSIPLGKDRLVVEFRAKAGALDAEIQGVHAYKVTGDDYARSAFVDTTPGTGAAPNADALKAGAELTDTARKVSVKVVSSGTASAKIAISLGGVPAPAEAANSGGTETGSAGSTGATDQAGADTAGTSGTGPSGTGTSGTGPSGAGAAGSGGESGAPGSRTDPQTGGEPSGEPAPAEGSGRTAGSAANTTTGSDNLAATGGDSSTLPLAAGGAAFLALGAAALIKLRRRRT